MEQTSRHACRGSKGFISKKKAICREKCIKTIEKKVEDVNQPICEAVAVITGRRVVDISVLGRELWCFGCNIPLSLKNIISERLMGLASIYKVQCCVCRVVREVQTSSKHEKSPATQRGPSTFDVNYKAALGLLDAGMGVTQLNTLLSVLNIPTVSANLLKRHERKIGPVIEAIAKESCSTIIQLETSLTSPLFNIPSSSKDAQSTSSLGSVTPTSRKRNQFNMNNQDDTPRKTRLIASYDMAWQCRGNGKSYNSQSGHGALMGHHTKKVLSYATRIKSCRQCSTNRNKKHDCRCNFAKSAKAMEADVAVQLVSNNDLFVQNNVELGVLVGDEDSSTMAGIRTISPNVKKWSDLNHIKKGFNNALYKLRVKHKVLQTRVIKYIKKCFSYAVKQNAGDSVGLKEAIQNIPDHIFGRHSSCKDWCTHKEETVAYKSLPKGQCLSGADLEKDLVQLFLKYANNSDKIAPCGSTQANEAFNGVVASKAPKNRFYSGSESLDYRVACAVNQTNMGTTYVVPVNEKLLLSPGVHTLRHRETKDKLRLKNKIRTEQRKYKKRRMQLLQRKTSLFFGHESRECTSYQTGMGLLPENNVNVEVIPLDVISGRTSSTEREFVYFDLETTGFTCNSQVIQIAAIYGAENYNAYILPKFIPEKVSEITGLSKDGNNLLLNGQIMQTVSRQDAWGGLVNFFYEINKNIILIGHNISFDLRFLLNETSKNGLQDHIQTLVLGFIDSLKVCKATFPGRTSYKQDQIASDLAISLGSAHNALTDALTLRAIMSSVSTATLETYVVAFDDYCNLKRQMKQVKENKLSLLGLRDVGLSARMIGKIASAKINFDNIKSVYEESKEEGIKTLLNTRVTKNKKVELIIINYLQSLSK